MLYEELLELARRARHGEARQAAEPPASAKPAA
jgi:hypothetical protein